MPSQLSRHRPLNQILFLIEADEKLLTMTVFHNYSVTISTEGIKIAEVCREGLFLLPYNELAVAQGPIIYQKNEL